MTTRKYLSVAIEIDSDIERGVYDQFPTVKERMIYLLNKLRKLAYIVNCPALSIGELRDLRNNGYNI